MPRKKTASLIRDIPADRVYNSVQIQRLINRVMLNVESLVKRSRIIRQLEDMQDPNACAGESGELDRRLNRLPGMVREINRNKKEVISYQTIMLKRVGSLFARGQHP